MIGINYQKNASMQPVWWQPESVPFCIVRYVMMTSHYVQSALRRKTKNGVTSFYVRNNAEVMTYVCDVRGLREWRDDTF